MLLRSVLEATTLPISRVRVAFGAGIALAPSEVGELFSLGIIPSQLE